MRKVSAAQLRAGVAGGVVGAVTSWLYELIVWVRLLHLTSAYDIADNTAVLSFGTGIRRLAPAPSRSGSVSTS